LGLHQAFTWLPSIKRRMSLNKNIHQIIHNFKD
jgi:hypothetical protein